MFDLAYYNEISQLIALEKQQVNESHINNQRRTGCTDSELRDMHLVYLRFRYLLSKHYEYFSWYYENCILQNRTRAENFELTKMITKDTTPSGRKLIKIIEKY